ncbi:hypothetical protein DENSPDRAFT_624194 [Dentipellis sp. KUC8613]|nr:hypothetical protein DENSPDRAFT_624194 [Dentipellis sp. KUC8613]
MYGLQVPARDARFTSWPGPRRFPPAFPSTPFLRHHGHGQCRLKCPSVVYPCIRVRRAFVDIFCSSAYAHARADSLSSSRCIACMDDRPAALVNDSVASTSPQPSSPPYPARPKTSCRIHTTPTNAQPTPRRHAHRPALGTQYPVLGMFRKPHVALPRPNPESRVHIRHCHRLQV